MKPVLFFSWLPIIGDPLTIVPGILNSRLLPVAFWVLLGRALRYVFVLWFSNLIATSVNMPYFPGFSNIPDMVFQVSFAVVFGSVFLIKWLFLRKSGVTNEVTAVKTYRSVRQAEGGWLFILRSIGMVLWLVSSLIYVIQPEYLDAFSIPLPVWLRGFGIVLGLLSLIFMGWTHTSLGDNYAVELKVKENHHLIQKGPYRFVRHPMYTATFMAALSCALISANLLLIAGTAIIAVLYITRIGYEEKALEAAFGIKYTRYKQTVTHRFIPGLY